MAGSHVNENALYSEALKKSEHKKMARALK